MLGYNTLDKFGPNHQELLGYPHFFGKTLQKLYKKDTTSRLGSSKKRTLSIVDREGKLLANKSNYKKEGALQSEYNGNFNEKSSIMKKKRAKTANTTRTEPSQGVDVWTRDSIVNVKKMLQPESFAELIQCDYQKAHIKKCQEKDRVEHLNKNFIKGNPRIFRNFIDTNSNLLR
jgi:hypothetical protein